MNKRLRLAALMESHNILPSFCAWYSSQTKKTSIEGEVGPQNEGLWNIMTSINIL